VTLNDIANLQLLWVTMFGYRVAAYWSRMARSLAKAVTGRLLCTIPSAYAEMIAMRDAAARHQVLRHPGAVRDCVDVSAHAFCAWGSVRAIPRRAGDSVKNAF
jgi:hypothetical protein